MHGNRRICIATHWQHKKDANMPAKDELKHLLATPLEADHVEFAPVLPEGRRLAFVRLGDRDGPNGPPLYACHGFPGSRYESMLLHKAAQRAKVLVIAMDRPGYGASDFLPGRELVHWPARMAALADHLGHERFRVLGISGGGPYAAVTAAKLPDRVTHLSLVCALGPIHDWSASKGMQTFARVLFSVHRKIPRMTEQLVGPPLRRFFRVRPDRMLKALLVNKSEPDTAFLKNPEASAILLRSLRESMAQGHRGPAEDLRIYTRPWMFDPSIIQVPTDIWQGEMDSTVPVQHARWYHEQIADSRLHLFPEDGHFSLPGRYVEEILAASSPTT